MILNSQEQRSHQHTQRPHASSQPPLFWEQCVRRSHYARSHWCSIRKIENKGISVRIYWGCLSVKQWKSHGSGTVVAQDPWNDAVSFWFICCWCLIKRALHGMNASWMDDFDMLIIIESWRAKARPVVWKVLKKKLVRTCMHVCT